MSAKRSHFAIVALLVCSPNVAPSLQTDLSRLEMLLHDFEPSHAPEIGATSSGGHSPASASSGAVAAAAHTRSHSSYSLKSSPADTRPTCTALFRFIAASPRQAASAFALLQILVYNFSELSLQIGDTLFIRRSVDANWIEVERFGYRGLGAYIFFSGHSQHDIFSSACQLRARKRRSSLAF